MIYEEKLAYRLTWKFDDPNPKESFSEFKERIIKAKREKHKIDEEWMDHIDGRAIVIDIDPDFMQPVFFRRDRSNEKIIATTEFQASIYEDRNWKAFVNYKIRAIREMITNITETDPEVIPPHEVEKGYFEIQFWP